MYVDGKREVIMHKLREKIQFGLTFHPISLGKSGQVFKIFSF